jgi:hypothetical protein
MEVGSEPRTVVTAPAREAAERAGVAAELNALGVKGMQPVVRRIGCGTGRLLDLAGRGAGAEPVRQHKRLATSA